MSQNTVSVKDLSKLEKAVEQAVHAVVFDAELTSQLSMEAQQVLPGLREAEALVVDEQYTREDAIRLMEEVKVKNASIAEIVKTLKALRSEFEEKELEYSNLRRSVAAGVRKLPAIVALYIKKDKATDDQKPEIHSQIAAIVKHLTDVAMEKAFAEEMLAFEELRAKLDQLQAEKDALQASADEQYKAAKAAFALADDLMSNLVALNLSTVPAS